MYDRDMSDPKSIASKNKEKMPPRCDIKDKALKILWIKWHVN